MKNDKIFDLTQWEDIDPSVIDGKMLCIGDDGSLWICGEKWEKIGSCNLSFQLDDEAIAKYGLTNILNFFNLLARAVNIESYTSSNH